MALYPDNTTVLTDLLNSTLPYYYKRKWVDLSQTRQDTVYSSRVIPKRKIKGGRDLRWEVQTSHTNSYRHRGMGSVETAQPEQHTIEAQVEWASASVSRAWITEMFDFNAGEPEIIDLMTLYIHGMWEDLINGEETDLWSAPASSSENPRRVFGIPFWFQKAASGTADFGFNGGNPTGFSGGAAGIDSTVHTNWQNGNFGYSDVSQNDLLPKLAEAMAKSYFKPPRQFPNMIDPKPQYVMYTTYPVIEAIQNLQTASNDNLGIDLGKFRETVMFKGVPMTWVPALTNTGDAAVDTQHPIYGINWGTVQMCYQSGWDWTPQDVQTPPDQPTARKLYMIRWGQYKCFDRRSGGFVGHTTSFAQ